MGEARDGAGVSRARADRPTLLIVSQVYVPDPASVGQHVADAAAEMVRRGWRVVVYASARGYDDPSQRYRPREVRDGVEIRRLPFSSFGKSSIKKRLLAQGIFLLQAIVHGLLTRRVRCVMVSTSPPMCSIAGVTLGVLRRAPVKFWMMDLNPDQMIALGMIGPRSAPARVFDFLNRMILKRSADVVALDRFMADRLNAKRESSDKMHVMPPWPLDDYLEVVAHADNPFRREHGLEEKFVVMYSGNHGPSNPIGTVIEAARLLAHRDDIVFMFIGGGIQKKDVEAAVSAGAKNIRSLPYQPLERIKYSLSAGDLHVVTVGDGIVGIVHPCKVYGAMAVARPVLLLGPRPCHVTDLLDRFDIGWHVQHGDAAGCAAAIERAASLAAAERSAMGARAHDAIENELSKRVLCGRFCDVLERGTRGPARQRRSENAAPAGAGAAA